MLTRVTASPMQVTLTDHVFDDDQLALSVHLDACIAIVDKFRDYWFRRPMGMQSRGVMTSHRKFTALRSALQFMHTDPTRMALTMSPHYAGNVNEFFVGIDDEEFDKETRDLHCKALKISMHKFAMGLKEFMAQHPEAEAHLNQEFEGRAVAQDACESDGCVRAPVQ